MRTVSYSESRRAGLPDVDASRAGTATSLICGPGELTEAHQPDESIARVAFETGAEHVLRVIERLCC